jgi:hypothetical protein
MTIRVSNINREYNILGGAISSATKIGRLKRDREIATMPQAADIHRAPQSPGNARHPIDPENLEDDSATSEPDDELTAKLAAWLADVGLHFNPFAPATLNAGDDPHLGTYLVGHDDFAAVWGDWISTILAPTGGGKSAFRVRLAYAGRIGEDGQQVFPVVYTLPRAATTLDAHLEKLTRSVAYELLLEMAYRPGRFEALDDETRHMVRQALDYNAPGWERFLPQLERAGGPSPLAETFDRSATRLPNPPDPDRVRALCATLRQLPADPQRPPVMQRWEQLTQLLLHRLRLKSIYILVDGADAYPETAGDPKSALVWLKPLLEQARIWAEARVFLKLFLPIELYDVLWQTYPYLLTFPAKFAKINWTPERLTEVLAARLRVASDGEFDSLDALCTPALGGLHRELAGMARPPIPREVLVLAGRVLVEHVRRSGAGDLLEPDDLKAAKEWYRSDRLIAGSPQGDV